MKIKLKKVLSICLSFLIISSFYISNCFAADIVVGAGAVAAAPVVAAVGVVAAGTYAITHRDEIAQGAKVLFHKMNPDKGGKTVAPRINCKSRKEAYERAKNKPRVDYNGKYGPHCHPQSGNPEIDKKHLYFPK